MNKQLAAIATLAAALAAAAGLFAAVGVPAASAKLGRVVKLSLLPLPRSALGAAAQGLRLERDSGLGVVYHLAPSTDAAVRSPLSPNRLLTVEVPAVARLGWVKGYALDYGLGESGGAGVTEVWTSVDRYKTNGDAKTGLSIWKSADQQVVTVYDRFGLAITTRPQKVAPVGSSRFAFLVSYKAANIKPLFGFDEQFTQGRYGADVTVWAGRAARAEKLAPQLAGELEARIKLALAGRLHAKPLMLPGAPKAGPPPGGPDLSRLGLTPTDLGDQASSWRETYVPPAYDAFSLSQYMDDIRGQFGSCAQGIVWYATANQASFSADLFTQRWEDSPRVDLSGVGDGAQGVLSGPGAGNTQLGLLFRSGRLLEFVLLDSNSAISTSDAQSIAHAVANKINSAGLGN